MLAKALELSHLEQQGSQRVQRQPTFETKFQRTARASGPEVKITLTSVSMLSMNLRTVYFQIVTLMPYTSFSID